MNWKDLVDFIGSLSTMWLLFLHFLPVFNEILTLLVSISTLCWFGIRLYDRYIKNKKNQ